MDERTDLSEVAKLLPTAAAQYLISMDNEAITASTMYELRKILAALEQCGAPLNPIQFDIVVTQLVVSATNAAAYYLAYENLSDAIEQFTGVADRGSV